MQNTKDTRVRLNDIAARANVSRVAVARVLLNTGAGRVRVGAEKAAIIRRLAKEMGYHPDNSAQMLKGKKSKVIGVLIDSYASQTRFKILSVVEQLLCRKGYRIMIGQTHDNHDNLKLYVADFTSRRVDGIICLAHGYANFDTVNDFKNFQHVVFVGEPRNTNVSYVDHDLKAGICKIVNHLLDTGRRRIGHFLLDSGSMAMIRRLEGYREELARHNIQFDEKLIYKCSVPTGEDDYIAAIEYLVNQQKADAIIANNDEWGARLVKYLKKSGIEVPTQVAVAGCDNLDIAEISSPELTSIDVGAQEQGEAVYKQILGMIEGKDGYDSKHVNIVRVEPKLIIRESTFSLPD